MTAQLVPSKEDYFKKKTSDQPSKNQIKSKALQLVSCIYTILIKTVKIITGISLRLYNVFLCLRSKVSEVILIFINIPLCIIAFFIKVCQLKS